MSAHLIQALILCAVLVRVVVLLCRAVRRFWR